MKFLSKTRWMVLDCLSGSSKTIERVPFSIGSDPWADFRLEGTSVFARHCEITHNREQGYYVAKMDPEGNLAVNGMDVDFAPLKPFEDYSLAVGHHLLLIRGDKDLPGWQRRLQLDGWTLHHPDGTPMDGVHGPVLDLCLRARAEQRDPHCILVPGGAGMGFRLSQLLAIFAHQLESGSIPAPAPLSSSSAEPSGTSVPTRPVGSEDHPTPRGPSVPVDESALMGPAPLPITGPHRCPVCLLQFSDEHVLHIAVHESIRGVRFQASRFNDQHQALDACGIPCPDMACPHCHRALFPGFLHLTQHILSIVGDQSAGKSYFLSVLVRVLRDNLFLQFPARFLDGHPEGNAELNDMVKTLFSAQTPEEAQLAKTVLDGKMYEKIQRYGSLVPMPKPFVYFLESLASQPTRRDHRALQMAEEKCALIFYDNAGEHFQPGRDSAESPGAQHIASSDGILFLFDPFNNPNFRRQITHTGLEDPQLKRLISDQQEIILSEMRARLIRLLNLKPGQKIRTPLAVLVGKCDAWLPMVQARPFRQPNNRSGLDLEAIHDNSARLRELMVELAPGIVANSESLSSQVLYFPISSFGHTPVNTREGHCVPDPSRLEPIMVDLPLLWILSQIEPRIVPPNPHTIQLAG